MGSIECNIKFRLSSYSSFKAWNGLEALFHLVIEIVSSAATIWNQQTRGIYPLEVVGVSTESYHYPEYMIWL